MSWKHQTIHQVKRIWIYGTTNKAVELLTKLEKNTEKNSINYRNLCRMI